MKKKFKYFLAIMLSVIMLFSFPLSASAFARKDVTKAYQKSVAKMMRNFDYYMGLGCLRNYQFKFDDYAKTTMVAIPDYKLNGQSFSYVKKKIQPQMKLYFNTTKVTFKKMNTYRYSKNPAYLIYNKNNKIIYKMGDWREARPKGSVRKIVKTGLQTYEVTYNVYLYNSWDKVNYGLMGTYKINLKKSNNKNGFIITNMKQTVNKKL